MDLLGRRANRALGESSRRCTATNRNGERCGRWAILGAFVCKSHGGGAPHVQSAARRRLAALVDPAMEALLRALDTAPPCPTCGRTDSDRDPTVIKAAQLVLDRAGFPATVAVDVHHTDGNDLFYDFTSEELAAINKLIEAAKARILAERAQVNDDVIDIEVGYGAVTAVAKLPENRGEFPSTQVVATCAPGSEDDDGI